MEQHPGSHRTSLEHCLRLAQEGKASTCLAPDWLTKFNRRWFFTESLPFDAPPEQCDAERVLKVTPKSYLHSQLLLASDVTNVLCWIVDVCERLLRQTPPEERLNAYYMVCTHFHECLCKQAPYSVNWTRMHDIALGCILQVLNERYKRDFIESALKINVYTRENLQALMDFFSENLPFEINDGSMVQVEQLLNTVQDMCMSFKVTDSETLMYMRKLAVFGFEIIIRHWCAYAYHWEYIGMSVAAFAFGFTTSYRSLRLAMSKNVAVNMNSCLYKLLRIIEGMQAQVRRGYTVKVNLELLKQIDVEYDRVTILW